jgi:hypothetical protein
MRNCSREESQEQPVYLFGHFLFCEKTLNICNQNVRASLRIFLKDLFSSISNLFVILSAILAFSMVAAAPSLGKDNSYYSHAPDAAYQVVYEPVQYEYNHRDVEHKYPKSNHYFQHFFYYFWHWLWSNIVPVIIIAFITWIFFRIYYSGMIK